MWAVQLDNYIESKGVNCIEHRITQGNESSSFMKLFEHVE